MALIDNFGGSEVTVLKQELLDALRKNRSGHRAEFLKAQEGYRAAVIQELDNMLSDARNGKVIRRVIALEEPQDHTTDYDRVIRMLEMSTAESITVSETQFSQYVMDEWNWMRQFKTTNSRYTG